MISFNITPAHFTTADGKAVLVADDDGFPRISPEMETPDQKACAAIALAIYENCVSLNASTANVEMVINWVRQYQDFNSTCDAATLASESDGHVELDDDDITEIEAQIRRDQETNFRITHHYDIGNQDVYVKRRDGNVDGKRAALYCHFQCESWFGSDAMLSNLAIGALLCMFYGYRHRAADGPVSECSTTVDMYSDREAACGTYLELLNDVSLHRAGMREVMETLFERA